MLKINLTHNIFFTYKSHDSTVTVNSLGRNYFSSDNALLQHPCEQFFLCIL